VSDSYDARGRVALVMGANKGIGFATAVGLGRLGSTVLVGSRNERRGEEAVSRLQADGIDARLLILDVTDDASVAVAAREVEEGFGRLDIVVNNAAVKLEVAPSPPSECSLEMVRATFETNVFGSIRVLLAMVPLLRGSDAPRIVNVSSGLGSLTLEVNAADPGYTNTDMTGSGDRGPDEGAAIVIQLATLPADGPTGKFFDDHGALPW
jgi:NAD(P)-dependent dehydrogenase (short-subunit alcohol dehydrogenase family)